MRDRKIVLDELNKYRSELKRLKNPKMDRRDMEPHITNLRNLEFKVERLKEEYSLYQKKPK